MRGTTVILGAMLAMGAAGGVLAAPGARSVPFAPHGDAVDGSSGVPVALSPQSLVVSAEGADGTPGTADDVTLLVTSLDGEPVVTALPTAYASTYSSRITRLSATRTASSTAGSDGVFGTADDSVLVLDRLGSQNLVLPIVVGGLSDNQQYTPVRLSTDRVVIASRGTDLTDNTSDDEIVVIDDAAGSPVLKRIVAPFQRDSGRSQPIALSESVVVIAGNGPDRKNSTADDVVQVIRGIGGDIEVVDVPAAGLNRRAAGRPVRLTATTALVVTAGPDLKDSTEDDIVLLVDTVAGTGTEITVPYVKNATAGRPTVLSPTTAVCSTNGADGVEGTADDSLAVLSALDGEPTVTFHVVGATGDDNNCRPERVDRSTCALVTFGDDLVAGTADDAVTFLSGADTTPAVSHVTVGAVATGTTSAVVPISSTALLVAGGGEDGVVGTIDDAVVVVTGIGGDALVESVAAGGAFDEMNSFRYVAQVLGGGRAALLASGPDGALGEGGDDAVRVLSDLVLGSSLKVKRLRVKLAREGSDKQTTGTLRARLVVEDPLTLLESDVVVSVGNASQTLPAGSLVLRKGAIRYDDPDNQRGFVRKLRVRTKNGQLKVVTRGANDELGSTEPGYVPIGVEIGDVLVPRAILAKRKGRRLVFGR